MKNYKLIGLFHIISLSLFLISTNILHVIFNNVSKYYNFFDMVLSGYFLFDFSLLLFGFCFFIEFYLTFYLIGVDKK